MGDYDYKEDEDFYEGDSSGGFSNYDEAGYGKAKKKRKRNNKLLTAMVSIITALVLFVVLLVIADRVLNGGMTQPVVVAVAPIPRGTVITQENILDYMAVQQRDIEAVPNVTTYSNGYALVGMVTERDIFVNEIITEKCFVEYDFFEGIVDPVEISIQVGDIGQAVAGTLRAGDLIDIKVVVRASGQTAGTSLSGTITDKGNSVSVSGQSDTLMSETSAGAAYGVTGNYAAYTIAEGVRVIGVYTSGGELYEKVATSGETMVATVINVVIPRSLQDDIYIAMEEGTIRLARVEERKEEVAEEPGATEAPVEIEESVAVEAPEATDEPAATMAPVESEAPVTSEDATESIWRE